MHNLQQSERSFRLSFEANDGSIPLVPENSLLAQLPDDTRTACLQAGVGKQLSAGDLLRAAGEPIASVYFISSGLISITSGPPNESNVEVASVGRGGLVGLSLFFGAASAQRNAVVRTPVTALEIAEADFAALADEHAALREGLAAYARRRMDEYVLVASCNALHRLDQRLARWILTAYSRLEASDIPITHRDLSSMLGVRRASVTETLHLLEGHQAVRSRRGVISVRSISKLREMSCGCHNMLQHDDELARAFPVPRAGDAPQGHAVSTRRPRDGG